MKRTLSKPLLILMNAALLLFMGCSIFLGGGLQSRSSKVHGNMYRDNSVGFKDRSIAIVEFKSQSGGTASDGQYAADMIMTELLFGGFNVLERRYFAKVLEEQATAFTGVMDTESEQDMLMKIGKTLGVDLIMVGSVTYFGYDLASMSAAVSISCRLIDVSSGKVVWTFSANKQDSNLQMAMYGVCLAVKESLVQSDVYIWQEG